MTKKDFEQISLDIFYCELGGFDDTKETHYDFLIRFINKHELDIVFDKNIYVSDAVEEIVIELSYKLARYERLNKIKNIIKTF